MNTGSPGSAREPSSSAVSPLLSPISPRTEFLEISAQKKSQSTNAYESSTMHKVLLVKTHQSQRQALVAPWTGKSHLGFPED